MFLGSARVRVKVFANKTQHKKQENFFVTGKYLDVLTGLSNKTFGKAEEIFSVGILHFKRK